MAAVKRNSALAALALLIAATLCSCVSTDTGGVTRIAANSIIDLDGFWNETDVRIVCNSLISDCVSSPVISRFKDQNKRAPIAIIGKIRNQSSEHIDTSIVEKKFQNAIINSGVLEFVADSDERLALRQEKGDQSEHSTFETAKDMDAETAADFMLMGSVKTIVQSDGGTTVRTYYVYAELHDITTNKIVWMSENDSIKKVVKQAKLKF